MSASIWNPGSSTGQLANAIFITPEDFGAVGDGIVNDTAALQAFLNAAMTGLPAFWTEGIWSIDEDVLVIQPTTNVHTPGPVILTAGYKATILKGRGTTQGPMLKIQNLTQVSGAGKFMKGGILGSIGFDGTGQPSGWTTAHALTIRGIDGWEFGYIAGDSLRGDLVRIPQNLYAGYNPDPYHVAFCIFAGLQSNFGAGWTLNNDNYVGFTSCVVQNIACYGASNGFGALRSCGAGNTYQRISVGTCWGWAVDIYDGSAGGRASREIISMMELDDPQYGIRIVNADQSIFNQIRIVHRYHSDLVQYWPRTAVEISNAASTAALSNSDIDVTHRIEAGGLKANLGKFLECNNSTAVTGVNIRFRINDNATFGFTTADILGTANIASSAQLVLQTSLPTDRVIAYDSRPVIAAVASMSGGATIGNGTFATAGGKIAMGSEVYDVLGHYNAATYEYTVPVTGLYQVQGCVHVTGLVAGNLVRIGLWNGSAIVKMQAHVAVGANRQGYSFSGIVQLTKGTVVSLNADTNTGSAKSLDNVYGTNGDNFWSIALLSGNA